MARSRAKTVVVTVYVERPRRRTSASRAPRSLSSERDQSGLPPRRRWKPEGAGSRGYDRRAELLRYSQELRRSAAAARNGRGTSSPAQKPKAVARQPQVTRSPARRKRTSPRKPMCSCTAVEVAVPTAIRRRMKSLSCLRTTRKERKENKGAGIYWLLFAKHRRKLRFLSRFTLGFLRRWKQRSYDDQPV